MGRSGPLPDVTPRFWSGIMNERPKKKASARGKCLGRKFIDESRDEHSLYANTGSPVLPPRNRIRIGACNFGEGTASRSVRSPEDVGGDAGVPADRFLIGRLAQHGGLSGISNELPVDASLPTFGAWMSPSFTPSSISIRLQQVFD